MNDTLGLFPGRNEIRMLPPKERVQPPRANGAVFLNNRAVLSPVVAFRAASQAGAVRKGHRRTQTLSGGVLTAAFGQVAASLCLAGSWASWLP